MSSVEEAVSSDPQSPSLDPSELGTKEYWDKYYENDIQDRIHDNAVICDPSDLESWFDDVGAPSKVLDFLSSETFPLSPNYIPTNTITDGPSNSTHTEASVLDVGTGNGSMLFSLRLQARYYGTMVGVDYSPQSVDLARRLGKMYGDPESEASLSDDCELPPEEFGCDTIRFEPFDVIRDNPKAQEWWPTLEEASGFDLVLDKGTFDAISLSSELVPISTGKEVPVYKLYPSKVIEMVKPGGFLLITSCNWTEEEVVRWLTTGEGVEGRLDIYHRIKYPTFQFGGKKGQGVASVCFSRRY